MAKLACPSSSHHSARNLARVDIGTADLLTLTQMTRHALCFSLASRKGLSAFSVTQLPFLDLLKLQKAVSAQHPPICLEYETSVETPRTENCTPFDLVAFSVAFRLPASQLSVASPMICPPPQHATAKRLSVPGYLADAGIFLALPGCDYTEDGGQLPQPVGLRRQPTRRQHQHCEWSRLRQNEVAGNRAILIPGYRERCIHDIDSLCRLQHIKPFMPYTKSRASTSDNVLCRHNEKTWLRRRRSAQRHFTAFVHTCRLPCLDLREISCCASGYLDAGEDRRRQDRGGDPYTSLMQLRDKPVSSRLSTSPTTDQCSNKIDATRSFRNFQADASETASSPPLIALLSSFALLGCGWALPWLVASRFSVPNVTARASHLIEAFARPLLQDFVYAGSWHRSPLASPFSVQNHRGSNPTPTLPPTSYGTYAELN
ncbi:uncharacterized protein CLUP02_18075 [Colletotrichum lupini]|uniref:Uncharacterized protein n=1 Tax=Colletotrichum lupini TaxID=145971 RepID=A0A9Q8SHG1_9PEZI|nr:uncharacterized protein CLUP02_18075 [Colletotrichum lupini]UQC76562.1 hypothetical protein CLUP02_18075 [Colletotrichum lupini]